MRRIPDSKITALKQDGVKITADGKRYIPAQKYNENVKSEPEPSTKTPESGIVSDGFYKEVVGSMVAVIQQQQAVQATLAQYGNSVANALEELAKPKKWDCAVSRNAKGQISNINIEEK